MHLHDRGFSPICVFQERVDVFCGPCDAVWSTLTPFVGNRKDVSNNEDMPVCTLSAPAEEKRNRLVTISGKEMGSQHGVLLFGHA